MGLRHSRAVARSMKDDAYEDGRLAGRREILALLAKLSSPVDVMPTTGLCVCGWCGIEFSAGTHGFSTINHPANDCLWFLATRSLQEVSGDG